jgi:hypothetical protein
MHEAICAFTFIAAQLKLSDRIESTLRILFTFVSIGYNRITINALIQIKLTHSKLNIH